MQTQKARFPGKLLLALATLAAMLVALIIFNNQAAQVKLQHQALAATTPVPTMAPPQLGFTPQAVLLRNGSIGPEVIALQQRLFDLGFYTGDIDGKYYEGTASAVKEFQSQHQLDADGMAGEKTLAVLFGQEAKHFVAPSASPGASPGPTTVNDGSYVRPGSYTKQRLSVISSWRALLPNSIFLVFYGSHKMFSDRLMY